MTKLVDLLQTIVDEQLFFLRDEKIADDVGFLQDMRTSSCHHSWFCLTLRITSLATRDREQTEQIFSNQLRIRI